LAGGELRAFVMEVLAKAVALSIKIKIILTPLGSILAIIILYTTPILR
jgi:hypothetical protein